MFFCVDSVNVIITVVTVLGLNDTSTNLGHFVLSPREREMRDRIGEEMKERDRGERGK